MKIDLFVWAVREPETANKIDKKGQQRYTSRMRGGGTPKDGELKLGTFVEPIDFINRTSFYLFLMNSFRASGGGGVKNEDLPLKGIWLLQHCLAFPRWHVICCRPCWLGLSPGIPAQSFRVWSSMSAVR
jgi:hypothetical protein